MELQHVKGELGERGRPEPSDGDANISPADLRVRLRTPRLVAAFLAMITFGVLAIATAGPAAAATQPGYPTALVQYQASTRSLPYVRADTYWGYAYSSAPGQSSNQTVSVSCWYDGDWATGNYRTNRWFKVYVVESYDGYATPRWLFVHASYVYNQPPNVRQCYRTDTGIW